MWLQGRPHSIQGICLLNIERGKAISKSQITETETNGNFCLQASAKAAGDTEDGKWIVSIPNGHCSCPSFVSSHVPCKHMFAVIHHYPTWTWESLPLELTNSPHMVLDASAIDSVLHTEPPESPESTSFSTDNATIVPVLDLYPLLLVTDGNCTQCRRKWRMSLVDADHLLF